jgi:ABC-type nickel/cobalt efflux system permease component RcnA
MWESGRVGVLWGLGHSTSLLVAGLLVIGLGVVIPERVAHFLEFAVAIMIVALGSRVLYFALRKQQRVHVHSHTHDGKSHFHLHFHVASDAHPVVQTHAKAHSGLSRWRTFLVGIVHGVAGSAALTLLVLSEVMRGGKPAMGLAYLLVFGIGSTGGMLIMSCIIGLPFVIGMKLSNRLPAILQLTTAFASVVFGFFYAWQTIS